MAADEVIIIININLFIYTYINMAFKAWKYKYMKCIENLTEHIVSDDCGFKLEVSRARSTRTSVRL